MKIPLIVEEKDPKWILLGQILKVIDSRPVKQQLARQGMTPVPRAALMLRIVLTAMFFTQEISYVLEELSNRPPLSSFARVASVPTSTQLYSFLGRVTPSPFIELVLGILNTFCTPRQRGRSTILVDSTEIRVDLNWFRKKYTKRALERREFKWGFSASKGYYLGYKLTLAVTYPSMKPLCFLLHPGSPNDAKLYDTIMEELRRRRIARNGDLVVFDKGYFSYENYMKGVARYKTVPGIYPKKNTPPEKILNQLAYPLTSYGRGGDPRRRALYQRLKSWLRQFLERWEQYKPIRSRIEDFFKAGKEAFGWGLTHRYTQRSAVKYLAVGVLLTGLVIHMGFRDKKALQRLSAWCPHEHPKSIIQYIVE